MNDGILSTLGNDHRLLHREVEAQEKDIAKNEVWVTFDDKTALSFTSLFGVKSSLTTTTTAPIPATPVFYVYTDSQHDISGQDVAKFLKDNM